MSAKTVAETLTPSVEGAIVGEGTSPGAHSSCHDSDRPSGRKDQDPAEVESNVRQCGIRDDVSRKEDSVKPGSAKCVQESLPVPDEGSSQYGLSPAGEESSPVVVKDSIELAAMTDKLETKDDDGLLRIRNRAGDEDCVKEVYSPHVAQDDRGAEMENKRNENKVMEASLGEATEAIDSQSDDGGSRNPHELKSKDNMLHSGTDLVLIPESLSKFGPEMASPTVVPPSLVEEDFDDVSNLMPVSSKSITGSVIDVKSNVSHSDSDSTTLKSMQEQKKSSAVVESCSSIVSVTPGASVEVVHPIRTSFNAERGVSSERTTDETGSTKSAEFPVILPLSEETPLCSMRTRSFRRRSPRVCYESLDFSSQSPSQLMSASNTVGTIPESLNNGMFQEGLGGKVKASSSLTERYSSCNQNKELSSDTAEDKDKATDQQAVKSPHKEDSKEDGLKNSAVEACTEETLPPSVDMNDLMGMETLHPSVTDPRSSVDVVQDSASVIPCCLKPPGPSTQKSAVRRSRKRTRRSAKQEPENSDSDSERKQEELLVRRVKRTRSQRGLMTGSGSLESPSSISQSILTEPKAKITGKSQNVEKPPEPTQICEDTQRESAESRKSDKATGARLDDSVVLIRNMVKTQALKAKMRKGNVSSPSNSCVETPSQNPSGCPEKVGCPNSSGLETPCQNTPGPSECQEDMEKLKPAMVCGREEDCYEGRRGKNNNHRVLRSSAMQGNDNSKCCERNGSQPCERAKVGAREKNHCPDGVKQSQDKLNTASMEGEDVMHGSIKVDPDRARQQSPLEEASGNSERRRSRTKRRRGKMHKPVIVETDSDSDSPFELTDVVEDQGGSPESEVTKSAKPEASLKQAQVMSRFMVWEVRGYETLRCDV